MNNPSTSPTLLSTLYQIHPYSLTYPSPFKLQTPNQKPYHNFPQLCGWSKSVCPVFVRHTESFQSNPRKSIKLIECSSNQLKLTAPSLIFVDKNQSTNDGNTHTQPSPLPLPSLSLWENKICMSDFLLPIDNLQQQTRTRIMIKDHWYVQFQSTIT